MSCPGTGGHIQVQIMPRYRRLFTGTGYAHVQEVISRYSSCPGTGGVLKVQVMPRYRRPYPGTGHAQE